MIGKLIGALIGSRIDREDGSSGTKGAIIGAVSVGLVRRLAPVGLAIAGAVVAKKLVDKARGHLS